MGELLVVFAIINVGVWIGYFIGRWDEARDARPRIIKPPVLFLRADNPEVLADAPVKAIKRGRDRGTIV